MKGPSLALLVVVLSFARPGAAEEPPAPALAADDARSTSATSDAPAPVAAPPPAAPTGRGLPDRFSPYASMSDSELGYAYEHTSLAGPIALTVTGGVISLLALPTFLVSGIGSLVCSANQIGDCTGVDTVTAVSGISTVVFGTMTVVGVIMLSGRSSKRTAIKNEMWKRQSQSTSLTLGLSPVRAGTMLAVGGTF